MPITRGIIFIPLFLTEKRITPALAVIMLNLSGRRPRASSHGAGHLNTQADLHAALIDGAVATRGAKSDDRGGHPGGLISYLDWHRLKPVL